MNPAFVAPAIATVLTLAAAGPGVVEATQSAGIAFLNTMSARDFQAMIDEGVRIGANPGAEVADLGRRYTGRTMPW